VDIAPGQEGNNDAIVAQMKTDRFDLPIVLRIGVSRDWRLPAGSRLTVALDGVNPNDNGQSLSAGVEFAALNDILFLRAGADELFLEDREKGLTLGAGLRIPANQALSLTLGYAYQGFRHLRSVNHFSIEIGF
jgi:opacity protein-like surface antigen